MSPITHIETAPETDLSAGWTLWKDSHLPQ